MQITSAPFRMDRKEFARIATRQFVQKYWPVYALAIITGLILIGLNPSGFTLIVGVILVIYPFTVPMRYSNLVSLQAAKFLRGELTYTVDDDELVFRSSEGGVTRGKLSAITGVFYVMNSMLFRFGKGTFIILPLGPITLEERVELMSKFLPADVVSRNS